MGKVCVVGLLGFVMCFSVVWFGCATSPLAPTAKIVDGFVEYTPPENTDDDILGSTSNGVFLVRGRFVERSLRTMEENRELKGRLREQELKNGQ